MNREIKISRSCLFACLVLTYVALVGYCQPFSSLEPISTLSPSTNDPNTFEIPFKDSYSAGADMISTLGEVVSGIEGGGVRLGIPQGGEKTAMSRAIILAVQEMEYSIIEPNIPPGELLPEGQDIITDAVPLEKSDILSYNLNYPLAPLSSDALYRLKYRLQYGIDKHYQDDYNRFSLTIWSILERRGAGGKWHAYPKSYSGRFFAYDLHEIIAMVLFLGHEN